MQRQQKNQKEMVKTLQNGQTVVTSGGISVGAMDCVKQAFAEMGGQLDFWTVAIKPGKPIAFGRRGGTAVLGLPGNPASAIVTFTVFGMPLLRAMQRDARPVPTPLRARMASSRKRSPDRLELVRATLHGLRDIMSDPKGAAVDYVKAVPQRAGQERQMGRVFELYNQYVYPGQAVLGRMDEARLASLQDFYLKQGIIEKATPVKDLYTNEFVQ